MSKHTFEDWINHSFIKTKPGHKIYKKIKDHETRIKQLESGQSGCTQSHIDLEMFGVKLFKAKLMNVTKGIFISAVLIGIILIVIFNILN